MGSTARHPSPATATPIVTDSLAKPALQLSRKIDIHPDTKSRELTATIVYAPCVRCVTV